MMPKPIKRARVASLREKYTYEATASSPYARAVTHVHAPTRTVAMSYKTIPRKAKAKPPSAPIRFEKGIIVASIGSTLGARNASSRNRKRKTPAQAVIAFGHTELCGVFIGILSLSHRTPLSCVQPFGHLYSLY